MMGFGDVFGDAVAKAQEISRSMVRDIGAAGASAYDKAAELAEHAKEVAVTAAKATGKAIVKGAGIAMDGTVAVAQAVGTGVAQTGQALVDLGDFAIRKTTAATIVGSEVVVVAGGATAVYTAKKAGAAYDTASKAYKDVKEQFFPHVPVASPCMPCAALQRGDQRKARMEKRNELIAAGQKSGRPATKGAATRLRDDMKAVELARLSDNTYERYDPKSPNKKPPEPWHVMTPEEIKAANLSESLVTGSKAVIYTVPSDFPFDPKTVVAFRGTTGEAEDILADHDQALGTKNVQYEAAKALGIELSAMKPPPPEVTGHSLGGGKAQAAGIYGGLKGQMFNSAGLHPETMEMSEEGLQKHAANFIQNRATGDPLTGLQNSFAAQEKAYSAAKVLQAVGKTSHWAHQQMGITDPFAVLPLEQQGLANDLADRVLHVTPQLAAKNLEDSGGKWYVPPAVGGIREVTSLTDEGKVPGLAGQHSIKTMINGYEARKAQDIQQLLDDTGTAGTVDEYIAPVKYK